MLFFIFLATASSIVSSNHLQSINLIEQKEPTLDFQNQTEKSQILENKNVLYFKEIVKVTKEDLKKHKEFLKTNLKKNFFN